MGLSALLANVLVAPGWGELQTLVGRIRMLKDLGKGEGWSEMNQMQLDKDECRVLRLGWNNRTHKCSLGKCGWFAVVRRRTWGF